MEKERFCNMFSNKFRLFSLVLMFHFVAALRILAVFPTVTRSHYLPGRRIMMELLKRGHEIVCISPFEEERNLANFTHILIEAESFFDAVPNLKDEINGQYNFFTYQAYVWRTMNAYANYITNRPMLRDFIEHDTSRFDLVLSEEFFLPLFYSFSYKYQAPLAVVTAYGVAQYVNEYMTNPMELSRATHEFLELTEAHSIYERALNLICTVFDIIGRRFVLVEYQDQLARHVFKNMSNFPHLGDMERKVDLVLVNSHFSFMDVMPNLPNVVEIGGVHIEDVKALQQDLQQVLDGADEGAILFSFGSILDIDSQPDAFVNGMLTVLGELNQRVIIKIDSERNITETYKNIYPFKWLPQNDILAHPNLVLFITHGGLLSVYEAIHHGVPIVCIPMQASQPKNCLRASEMGIGVHLKVDSLTTVTLKNAIERVLNDPTYRIRMEATSARFRDRMQSPLDTAVDWIEHCARFGAIFKREQITYVYDHLQDSVFTLCLALLTVFSIRKSLNIRFRKI